MGEKNEKEGEKDEKRKTHMGEGERFRKKKRQIKAGRGSEEREEKMKKGVGGEYKKEGVEEVKKDEGRETERGEMGGWTPMGAVCVCVSYRPPVYQCALQLLII